MDRIDAQLRPATLAEAQAGTETAIRSWSPAMMRSAAAVAADTQSQDPTAWRIGEVRTLGWHDTNERLALCNGQSVDPSVHTVLDARLGTTFGAKRQMRIEYDALFGRINCCAFSPLLKRAVFLDSANRVIVSDDGCVTYRTAQTLTDFTPISVAWSSVRNRFVAVGVNATNAPQMDHNGVARLVSFTSPDGVIWTRQLQFGDAHPTNMFQCNPLFYDEVADIFIMSQFSYWSRSSWESDTRMTIWTSPDGVNWTNRFTETIPTANNNPQYHILSTFVRTPNGLVGYGLRRSSTNGIGVWTSTNNGQNWSVVQSSGGRSPTSINTNVPITSIYVPQTNTILLACRDVLYTATNPASPGVFSQQVDMSGIPVYNSLVWRPQASEYLMFLGSGGSDSTRVMRSTNGTSWSSTQQNVPGVAVIFSEGFYGEEIGSYIVVGASQMNTNNRATVWRMTDWTSLPNYNTLPGRQFTHIRTI
jgi:hypothetical protein